MAQPRKSILDRTFSYTPSTATDIRKTFAKARRAMGLPAQPESQPPSVVFLRKRFDKAP